MNRHAEEEDIREGYYIHCRKRGYTIDEASERSLAYIKRILNADKSLTSTRYLEQLYQESIARPEYSSTPFSYDGDSPRRRQSLRQQRDGGKHDAFDDFSGMTGSLRPDKGGIYGHVPNEYERNWSVPGYQAPNYVPSPYDYQNRAPDSHSFSPEYIPSPYDYQNGSFHNRFFSFHRKDERERPGAGHHASETPYTRSGNASEESEPSACRGNGYGNQYAQGPSNGPYGYAHVYYDSAPPRQYSYDSGNRSHNGSSYTTQYRQPSSGYSFPAGNSTSSPYSSSPPSYTFYSPPNSYPAGSSYSFRPRAAPSQSFTQPTSSQRPVTPPPRGIKPTTDLYTVLGLTRNATAADIKKAHRVMSLKWHPDRCAGQNKEKATQKMAEINQANDVLCDDMKRGFYNRWGLLPSEI